MMIQEAVSMMPECETKVRMMSQPVVEKSVENLFLWVISGDQSALGFVEGDERVWQWGVSGWKELHRSAWELARDVLGRPSDILPHLPPRF